MYWQEPNSRDWSLSIFNQEARIQDQISKNSLILKHFLTARDFTPWKEPQSLEQTDCWSFLWKSGITIITDGQLWMKWKCLSCPSKHQRTSKEAEGNGHAGMDILYQVRMPARVYIPRKGLKDITLHQGHQECAGKKGTSCTKFSGGSSLQAEADSGWGHHRVGLSNIHGNGEVSKKVLPKWW